MTVKYILSVSIFLLFTNISDLSAQDNNNSIDGLYKLSQNFNLYYSTGYEVRARTIQEFITEAIAFYKFEFPEISPTSNIFILDKNDWTARYNTIAYGIPFFDEKNGIVIPADKFTASGDLGYEDLSTDQEISEYDKFIISVLGQSYISKNRTISIPEVWMRDLMATYFAIAFFEVNDFLWELNPDQNGDILHRTLDVYSLKHKELSAGNYYWYHSQFIEIAKTLFDLGGFQLLTELLDHFEGKGSIEEAEALILKYNEKEYPEWKAKMK